MFGKRSRSIASIVLATLVAQIIVPILPTYANNTAYYVDATGGSDANDGLSPATAWQSLGHATLQTYLPGDQIRLKCGETWTGSLTIDDAGTALEPIVVNSYGPCDASTVATLANPSTDNIYIVGGADYIRVMDLTFRSGTGIINNGGTNIEILQNRFDNINGVAIINSGSVSTNIQNNYFNVSTGSTILSNKNDGFTTITGNTFSGGSIAITMTNSYDSIINSNTIFKPATYAIVAQEDTTVPAGTMANNVITANKILSLNPAYTMIRLDDMNDSIGTIVDLSGNNFINVYKFTLPLVEVLGSGSSTVYYDKSNIDTLDLSATTFTEFGYNSGITVFRANEVKLLVNTGSSAANMSCPGAGGCPNQYVTTGSPATNMSFPYSVGAYSSEIILWRDASSYFTPASILHKPTGTFTISNGTPPNGSPIDLTWSMVSTGTTINNVTIEGDTNTGSFSYTVGNTGTLTVYPPDDSNTFYYVSATNDIGTTTLSGEVVATNSPPVALGGTATGTEDDAFFTGQVQATDMGSGALTYTLDTGMNPSHGFVNLESSGAFEIYPTANFCGNTSFRFLARDEDNAWSDPGIMTGVILCTNDTPVAEDDTLSATGGVTGTLDVVANDTDLDTPYEPQTFTVSGITLPSQGTLVASGSVFEYTPDLAFMGVETFTYVTIDQSGAISNTGTVTVNVAPGMNLPPNTSSGSYTLSEDDGGYLGTFSGSDANGDMLSYSATTLPTNGILTIMGTGFSYVPNTHFNGTDSFDFVANDGSLNSSGATISFTINSVMDAPVANNDTINVEMNTVTNLDVIVNDTDPDEPYQAQTLTLTGISTPTNGTAIIVGNEIQYTPTNMYLGSDSIDYIIVDQDNNMSNTGTVTISVTTSNQVPVADSGSYILTEDIPLTQTLSGSDPDGMPVTFVLDVDGSNGTVSLSATGEFTYTPDADFNGVDSFTFHVSDGVFDSTVQTVTLTIDPLNDNPVAVADTFTVNEDGSLDTTPLANDSDADAGDVFTLNSVNPAINGTAVMSGNLVTYTPNPNYCGTDTFQYTTVDLSGATSNAGSVTMTITCMNDAPAAASGSYTMTGNVITNSGSILYGTLSGSDIDVGDILTYNIIQNVLSGTLILTGSAFSYEPDIDFTGSDMFTFNVTDTGGLTSSTVTVNITVLPNDYNTAPVAYSGSFMINEDTGITNTLSGSDAEGDILTYILDTATSNGTVSLSSTGGFTYTPNSNYNGTDSFTFHVNDGENNSAVETITITINSVNDLPVAVVNTISGNEDSQLIIDPILNDTDADGDTLSLNSYTDGSYGTTTASGNAITYTPGAEYCGSDIVNYTAIDTNAGVSATGTININITCINDAPTASGDTTSTIEDTAIFIPVLGNDSDIEGDVLSVANLSQPSTGGTTTLMGTGVRFTPNPNFCSASPITFTYQARDTASALSNIATVTVTSVSCVNDTPTSINGSYTMTGNVVINPGVLSGTTLIGYLATSNSITQVLPATDVENDTIAFSASTLPIHGTGTLSSTGLLTYIPTPGYIGNDSLTYTVTDGVGTSSTYTITLVVQDPNPPVSTGPTSGPGGGGGGGSSMTNVYSSVATSSQTSSGLTAQLLLANPSVRRTTTTPKTQTTGTYRSFLLPIIEIVEETKIDPVSSKERATEIRRAGQKMLHTLTRSLILESVEKATTLKETESNLSTMSDAIDAPRESRALEFIIRLMKRERAKIEKGVEAMQIIMSI